MRAEATCGDDLIQTGVEECDDGDANTADAYFGCDPVTCTRVSWCGDAETQPEEECDPEDPNVAELTCTDDCHIERKVIFVTSATYNGKLGGLDGADAICQSLATAAGLADPTTYRAWLPRPLHPPGWRPDRRSLGGSHRRHPRRADLDRRGEAEPLQRRVNLRLDQHRRRRRPGRLRLLRRLDPERLRHERPDRSPQHHRRRVDPRQPSRLHPPSPPLLRRRLTTPPSTSPDGCDSHAPSHLRCPRGDLDRITNTGHAAATTLRLEFPPAALLL